MFPEKEPDERALSAASFLTLMAEIVTKNAASGFSGVFVIVPPGDGEVHTTLLLDPSENIAGFWSIIQTKAGLALEELAQKEREGNVFGRR